MTTVDVSELRRDASELAHRAGGGEVFVITVAGRPTARLVAATSRWCPWSDASGLFDGPADAADVVAETSLVAPDTR